MEKNTLKINILRLLLPQNLCDKQNWYISHTLSFALVIDICILKTDMHLSTKQKKKNHQNHSKYHKLKQWKNKFTIQKGANTNSDINLVPAWWLLLYNEYFQFFLRKYQSAYALFGKSIFDLLEYDLSSVYHQKCQECSINQYHSLAVEEPTVENCNKARHDKNQ